MLISDVHGILSMKTTGREVLKSHNIPNKEHFVSLIYSKNTWTCMEKWKEEVKHITKSVI